MKHYFIIFFLLLSFYAFSADKCAVSGAYDLIGWEPGDDITKAPSYTGVLHVSEHSGYYKFEGSADGMVFYGKGLTKDCKSFAFVFSSSDKTEAGVCLAIKVGSDLNVTWTYNLPDVKGSGKELWKRKK